MWIVAIAWIYVVVLMAATETSVVAGIMTFFGYCVLPLSILFYITGSKRRRARKAAAASAKAPAGYRDNRPDNAENIPDGGNLPARDSGYGNRSDGDGGSGDGD